MCSYIGLFSIYYHLMSYYTLYYTAYCLCIGDEFSVKASAIYSGDKITVTYDASAGAVCTCQLDSGSPVSCKN